MQLLHVSASLVALAAVAGPIAGCGSSDSGSGDTQSGASAPAATSTAAASQSDASGGSGSVTISDFKFAPASLTVAPGTRVTVANKDSTAHTATADKGNSFDTGDIDPGSSATVTLAEAGSYSYHCSIHPFMHGTLVVR